VEKVFEDKDDHLQELENLSILNHLRHPNIVELLASYTHMSKHSLLFHRAEHGTLATLLRTKRDASPFPTDATILVGLAGLSSAVEQVHNFFERRLDLKMIGCHHDLRPQNILVSGTSLILADFGLSKFKRVSRDSGTPFRMGMDDYLAPECEDLEENFRPLLIRRSSDIWSFGCIIAEIASYMALGEGVVEDFRARRCFKVRGFKLHLFHQGPNKASSVVAEWLLGLEESPVKSCALLVGLIRRMLDMDQSRRPKAVEVTDSLRLIALKEMAAQLDQSFDNIKKTYDSLDIVIEHNRFTAWSYAVGLHNLDSISSPWDKIGDGTRIKFDIIIGYLIQMREHLEWWHRQDKNTTFSFLRISSLNDTLFNLLALERQESARTFFRIAVVDLSIDTIISKDTQKFEDAISIDKDIRCSISLKHMNTLMTTQPEAAARQTQFKSEMVSLKYQFGEHTIGTIEQNKQRHSILVEWRRYGHQSADKSVNRELFTRLNAIVTQLSLEKPPGIRALDCLGYFHDEVRSAFGVLYKIPSSTDALTHMKPTTLHNLIKATTSTMSRWPVLDDKFRLAYTVARSVLEFHMVGWLHKGLSAPNIAFFPEHSTSLVEILAAPYITGFNHSRQDEPSAFSSGIARSTLVSYQHPAYRKERRGFRREYDYYSLGVVLAEIGFWRPVSEIARFGDVYGEEHDRKLRERIMQLGQHMGRDYCDAVLACFDGPREALDGENGGREVLVNFESKVLSRLAKRVL
jgi:serine/threonine protein kinase